MWYLYCFADYTYLPFSSCATAIACTNPFATIGPAWHVDWSAPSWHYARQCHPHDGHVWLRESMQWYGGRLLSRPKWHWVDRSSGMGKPVARQRLGSDRRLSEEVGILAQWLLGDYGIDKLLEGEERRWPTGIQHLRKMWQSSSGRVIVTLSKCRLAKAQNNQLWKGQLYVLNSCIHDW